MENDIDYSGLEFDPELQPLLYLEGITLDSLRCYTHWMRGYSEAQIARFFKITTEEAETGIALVKRLLPADELAQHVEDRNAIIDIQKRSADRDRNFGECLTRSADSFLKSRQNPASALREFREFIAADTSDLIPELRKRDGQICNEKEDERSRQAESQLISELRRADKKASKKDIPISNFYPKLESLFPMKETKPTQPDPDRKSRKNQTDKRITIRLDQALQEKVQKYRQNTGIELSMLVRRALSQFLQADTISKETVNVEMPQEALSLTGKYQVWGSDLREEMWMQFLRTIAAAFVATRRWHRDERSRRIYEGLIQLYYSLEENNVGQK
jgi:hypothetical protein